MCNACSVCWWYWLMLCCYIRTSGSCYWDLPWRVTDHWCRWNCYIPVQNYRRNSITNHRLETVILLFAYQIMHSPLFSSDGDEIRCFIVICVRYVLLKVVQSVTDWNAWCLCIYSEWLHGMSARDDYIHVEMIWKHFLLRFQCVLSDLSQFDFDFDCVKYPCHVL